MKRFSLIALLFLPLLAFSQDNYKTLFIGNSYTYVNDLPTLLKNLTLAGGDTLLTDASTPGGYTLQGHSTNQTTLNLIAARDWDFVVMQDQSQRPSFPQSQVQNQVYPYATILNDSVKSNDSCSVTVFFMTWGRKYGDAMNCGVWPPVCTFEGMSAELRRSYLNMANQNNALVAPVGPAWWEAIKRDSTIELYSPDESHPAYTGSYLAACVFYATMYRESPNGLNYYGSLDTTTATFLQQVAHDVVFDSLTQWRIGEDDAQANFAFTTNTSGEATFTNTSANASSYLWDFGDGNTDSVANPIHNYSIDGAYIVTLIANNGCTSDTMIDTLQLIIVGVSNPDDVQLQVFPNPSNGVFTIQGDWVGDMKLDLQVFDLAGKLVFNSETQASQNKVNTQVDLRSLPKGVYFLKLGNDEQNVHRRIIIA